MAGEAIDEPGREYVCDSRLFSGTKFKKELFRRVGLANMLT